MNRPKAIFFDLDDTLVDFDDAAQKAMYIVGQEIIDRYKLKITVEDWWSTVDRIRTLFWYYPEKLDAIRNDAIPGRLQIAQMVLKGYGIDDYAEALYVSDTYSKLQLSYVTIFEDTKEVLEWLAKQNIRMGVISNGDHEKQYKKIDRFHLRPFFEMILIDSEVGVKKPDRRIYEMALLSMGITPSEAWMIGDNLINDIKGAKDAGLTSIWFDRHGSRIFHDEMKPEVIIDNLSDLIRIIKEL